MSAEKASPHYIPAAALRRFADDLVSETNGTNKFLQINRDRINNFIDKPYNEPAKYGGASPLKTKRKTHVAGINEYRFDVSDTDSFIGLQSEAPFQATLGARSRFGDGDGSFFDRWLNSDALNSAKVRDKDGLPVMNFSMNTNQSGFKKMVGDYKDHKTPRAGRTLVQPYAQRKAERIRQEKEGPISGATSPDLKASQTAGIDVDRLRLPAINSLTAAERENYFGFEARSSFFDYYRQLNRQQLNSTVSIQNLPRSDSPPGRRQSTLGESADDFQNVGLPAAGPDSFVNGMETSRTNATDAGEAMTERSTDGAKLRFAAKQSSFSDLPLYSPSTSRPGTSNRSQLDAFRETYSRMRMRGSAPSEEEKQQLLDHLFALDPLDQRAARPSSARTKYLMGCVRENVIPRPALIVRKEYSSFLNLTSLGMGNDAAVVLASALDSLPLLEGLSIADNNLDDRGLGPIVEKLISCRHLKVFDLSTNKVDSTTAEALRKYLASDGCNLSVLRMQDANVDDNEAFRFMETIAVRNTIQELDLSHNLLGSHDMAIKRSSSTAGESISRLLRTDNCSLVSLSLAWNTIRYHSSVVLVESLKSNRTLTYLDLSYNGLGVEGGEALGNALHANKALRVVKVAHNNITSAPCFTLFAGIKTCETLQEVDLSGNPIGEEGARGLLTLNITYGYRVKVDIKNCSVRIKDSSCWYDPLEPIGEYVLDMSKPYERAVCFELLRAVARDPDLEVASLRVYSTEAEAEAGAVANTGGVEVKPLVGSKPIKSTNIAQNSMLTISTDSARELFRETADRIFQQYDADESGSLDRDELTFILEQLGLDGAWQWVDKLLSIYDTDNSGRVEEEEFVSFLLDVKGSYENEANWASRIKYVYDGTAPGHDAAEPPPYLPPEAGAVSIKVVATHASTNKFVQILSSKQVESLLNASKEVPDGTTLIELALSSNKWTINEAQAFFQAMIQENGSVLHVLLKVLPHMATPLDARMLIAYVTNHQFEQIQALKILLGPLYRIYIGVPNGFYKLNLADERDRDAFQRLAAMSLQFAEQRRAGDQGDTSQEGAFQSFRNSFLDNQRTAFTPEWLQDVPDKGHVEFDFVALGEVSMKENEISNLRLFRLLNMLGVADESKRKRIFAKLVQNKTEGRAAAKGTGAKRWEMGQNFAKEVAAHLKFLYESCVIQGDGSAISNRQARAYHIDVSKEELSVLEGKRRLRKLASLAMGASGTALTAGSRRNSRRIPARSSRRGTVGISISSIGSMSSVTSTGSAGSAETRAEGDSTEGAKLSYTSAEDIINNQDKLFKIPENPVNEADLGEVTTMDIYGHHIKAMLDNVMMERELIAIRVLDALETVLAGRYVTSAQLGLMVERFPFGNLRMSDFGTFRVELVVALFSRVIDVVNFEYVLRELESVEIAMVLFRLGWLNVWNPLKPEGNIVLDLSRHEERQVARMLITLSYVETGVTWQEQSFRQSLAAPPDDPNWKLPVAWFAEETLPKAGVLSLLYFSGKGLQLQGCVPNIGARMSLMSLVLAQPYAEDLWHSSDSVVDKAQTLVQKLGFRISFVAPKQEALVSEQDLEDGPAR